MSPVQKLLEKSGVSVNWHYWETANSLASLGWIQMYNLNIWNSALFDDSDVFLQSLHT